MARSRGAAILAVAFVAGTCAAAMVAQSAPDLTGRWTINRQLSRSPREIGFDVDWVATEGSGLGSTAGGGRGRRASGGGAAVPLAARPESEEDARRLKQLTAEVRDPATHLTVVETPTAVTIGDDREQSRTFHPDGREEVLRIDGVPVEVTAKREAGRLVVLYKVEDGRELRYSYSRAANPPQLTVDVEFIGRGGGDAVRYVYERATAETAAPSAGSRAPAAADSAGRGIAPPGLPQAPTYNQQPGAELKGLTKLGVVVEDLSQQAATCGLNQNALETAVSKHLSDAGFTVRQNSDEDTYVYVNIITTSPSPGFCISRYDVFLYSHTTATLSYQQTPVLVEVSLLHKGGIAGGAPASHADGVLRGVQEYVDQFAARIREANK